MKVVKKCVSLLICLVCLVPFFVFQVECLDYSEDSPSYVSEVGNFYIEVSTVELGRGTLILPNNYKYDYISTYSSGNNLYNTYSSTISGYIKLQNGNSYQIRFQGFSSAQYNSGSGVGYGYQDLTVNALYTTNGSILGTNGIKVYNIPDSDRILISVVLVAMLVYLVFGSVTFILRRWSNQ